MAMSGISVAEECMAAHDRQHVKAKDIQWVMYKIGAEDDDDEQQQDDTQHKHCRKGGKSGRQQVKVDHSHMREYSAKDAKDQHDSDEMCRHKMEELWKKLISELPDDEGRYCVLDYVAPKGKVFNERLRFISWVPDDAPVKSKMIYSSTKDTLKKKLGCPKETFLSSKNEQDLKDAFDEIMLDI